MGQEASATAGHSTPTFFRTAFHIVSAVLPILFSFGVACSSPSRREAEQVTRPACDAYAKQVEATFRIHGRVVRPDGTGVSSATIGVYGIGEAFDAGKPDPVCMTHVDEEGSFVLNLPVGWAVTLVAEAPELARSAYSIIQPPPPEFEIPFTLERPGSLAIELSKCEWPFVMLLDKQGFYHRAEVSPGCTARFEELSPGAALLWPDSGKEVIGTAHDVSVDPGATRKLALSLWDTGVTGSVMYKGEPVQGASVTVRRLDNLPEDIHEETDENGKFAFHEIEPGNWKIMVRALGKSFVDTCLVVTGDRLERTVDLGLLSENDESEDASLAR